MMRRAKAVAALRPCLVQVYHAADRRPQYLTLQSEVRGRMVRCRVQSLKPIMVSAALAAPAIFTGCASLDTRPNVGPCPAAGALYDAARLVEIKGEERQDNVGFTGSIEGVRAFCRYVGKNPIDMEIDVDFAFGRGPKAGADQRSYRYFVTVTRRDRAVLAKEWFTVDARFPRGATEARQTEKISGIKIPRVAESVSGRNFEVLVGFDLTPEQLEFNRSGKRFTLKNK